MARSRAATAFYLAIVLLILASAGCANLDRLRAQARANFVNNTCNYDGAYEYGVNSAKNGETMAGQRLAAYCPPQVRSQVMQGYRAGYMSISNRPSWPGTIILSRNSPQEECVEAYGKRVCGYGCVHAYGNLVCSRIPGHECIAHYGQITCGLNCRPKFGRIVCDIAD